MALLRKMRARGIGMPVIVFAERAGFPEDEAAGARAGRAGMLLPLGKPTARNPNGARSGIRDGLSRPPHPRRSLLGNRSLVGSHWAAKFELS